jgi:hypothetical protein
MKGPPQLAQSPPCTGQPRTKGQCHTAPGPPESPAVSPGLHSSSLVHFPPWSPHCLPWDHRTPAPGKGHRDPRDRKRFPSPSCRWETPGTGFLTQRPTDRSPAAAAPNQLQAELWHRVAHSNHAGHISELLHVEETSGHQGIAEREREREREREGETHLGRTGQPYGAGSHAPCLICCCVILGKALPSLSFTQKTGTVTLP